MKKSILYVGMDVHKETIALAGYLNQESTLCIQKMIANTHLLGQCQKDIRECNKRKHLERFLTTLTVPIRAGQALSESFDFAQDKLRESKDLPRLFTPLRFVQNDKNAFLTLSLRSCSKTNPELRITNHHLYKPA